MKWIKNLFKRDESLDHVDISDDGIVSLNYNHPSTESKIKEQVEKLANFPQK